MKNSEYKQLEKENKEVRTEINKICKDFKMGESKEDLWDYIDELIDNEIEMEKFCGE